MKMKKSTWLLLVLAIAAIFLVAGCAPTGPAPDEDENGEEPIPTPPPANYCPDITKIKTVVTSLGCAEAVVDANGGNFIVAAVDGSIYEEGVFSILITFDENIILLDENPAHWTVTVDRWVHYKDADGKLQKYEPQDIPARVLLVEQAGANSIRIYAGVIDDGTNATPNTNVELATPFCGLICDEACYEAFVGLIADAEPIEDYYVDSVSWEYTGTAYPYVDELGNICPDACLIKGEACCAACEECEEPSVPPCPPGGCI